MKRAFLLPAGGLLVFFVFQLAAQNRMSFSVVSADNGHVALGLALRKLNVSGTFMQTAAHPDDEHNALYALFTHGMGLRSIDVQTTRGEGGQNEIGSELFRDMGVLRTSELLSAHRLDGAEQYFARAIDFGYSFDPQEVINKWGREETVGDFVRLIRTFRPDVLVTMNIQGRGGDRAHEATTVLTREAFQAAGDPSRYPEQIREGLRPWQPRKLYFTAGFGGGRGGGGGGRGGNATGAPASQASDGNGTAAAPAPPPRLAHVNTGVYDPLLGRTYAEIAADARSNHKCQGVGGMPPLPGGAGFGGRGGGPAAAAGDRGGDRAGNRAGTGGGRAQAPPATGGPTGGATYQLMETSIAGQKDKDETSLFDGVDVSLKALADYAGPNPPEALTRALATISSYAVTAQGAFAAGNDAGTVAPIAAGLSAVRGLRKELAGMPLSDMARYELDLRLKIKEQDYEDALLAAHDIRFDAVADDGLVVDGQPVRLSIVAVNRGASEVGVTGVTIAGFDSPGNCKPEVLKKDAVYTCAVEAHVPKDARLTTPYFDDDYWKKPSNHAINRFESDVPFGAPFRATPFRAVFHIRAGDVDIVRDLPIEYRYMKDVYFGDKRMEVNVVPALSARISPALLVIPVDGAASAAVREVHVSVTNGGKGAAQASVSLELPAGWKASPASVPLHFVHEDESLSARFEITAPTQVKTGEYTLRAMVTSPAEPNQKFTSGYQEIEYPHVQRRQVIKPAETRLKVVEVKVVSGLNVGYIDGVGDQVPPAIEQLGARLHFIDQDELAWGDLSKYDVIVTGVRAYERRADLRAYNRRLLDYVEQGGAVIVQYNKMEFNQAEYGPFPARVSGNRVTDESAPVKVLVPDHPVFNYPNKIGPAAWAGWVQERGLYFLGEKDKKYTDLVSMTDPFPDNPGEKLGSLVEGRLGKGRWIYLGLGLWRQLPAGTDGAYQLLANLLSVGKAK